jgi:cyclohexadienyl dehydratase
MMIRPLLLFPLTLLTLAAASAPPAAASELVALMAERLALMDEVAAHKWQHGLPVEDPAREAVVLDRAVQDALRFGFTPESSRRFFAAQIDAAKELQHHWFARWQAGESPPGNVPDLQGALRPELLRLGTEILAAAAEQPAGGAPLADHGLATVPGLAPDSAARLVDAARRLERFANRLDQILATGVLRVGTTGDYAPFSHREGDAGDFHGIDVDLARELAAALDVRAVFVPTSWPRLLEDLQAGRYDIAMSGVSRILDRQQVGFLSVPYYVGGKAAIARCAEAGRYRSLSAIDRPGVRVVVNPGGTNERFVDTHVHRARKILHPDNRTVFRELVAGRADVMITDRIEVELQSARHEALCGTLDGTLTYQEKAYLMPRDTVWKAFVDTWLELALADGTVARVFRAHQSVPRLPHGAAGPSS